MKDDEIMIIGLIDEDKIEMGKKIQLKEVRHVFYDLIQVGPMFRTFINQLESEGKIEFALDDQEVDKVELLYCDVFKVLNSSEYLRDVPRVSLIFAKSILMAAAKSL